LPKFGINRVYLQGTILIKKVQFPNQSRKEKENELEENFECGFIVDFWTSLFF
jgi:hypothetical protein